MSRSRATAEAIGTPFGQLPQPLEGLIDIDYGKWQGLTPNEVASRWPEALDTWNKMPHWAAIPGGESLQGVLTRTVAALREVTRQRPRDTVVIVGHDSVNRVILLHALDLPLSRYWRLGQDPCAINQIESSESGFTVQSVNETYHLHEQ
jgi:probable phosphoglycerate mutase